MATSYNVNTDLVKGSSLLVYVGATPLAFAKSCDLSISADAIDTSNKMSGNFKSSLAGVISWTIASDFLYTQVALDSNFDTLFASMLAGTAIDVIVGTTADSTTYAMEKGLYSGKAYISSLSLKAGDTDVASCSVSLTGSGELVKVATV